MKNPRIFFLFFLIGAIADKRGSDRRLASIEGSKMFGWRIMDYTRVGKLLGRTENKLGRDSPKLIDAEAGNDQVLDYPKVNTTSGLIIGITGEDAHAFYEIPFAEPPVGSLRFQDPEPLKSRLPDINATLNSNIMCLQYYATTVDFWQSTNENEDCLVLNVFVPKSVELSDQINTPSARLPVMFYIHGGSFKINAGTDAQLDGRELANATNSIVVVTNYRLGALGFLVHKENGKSDITGNQGLKDQRLALKWVQNNIAQFGGDKNSVMLFGNSAGGQSIMFHTVSAESADLFSSSIQQSNANIFSFFYPDVGASLRISKRLVQALECNTSSTTERDCILTASARDIMDQMPAIEASTYAEEGNNIVYLEETFMPVIEGIEFTDQAVNLYREGKWNKDKPMIIGVNTEESEDNQFYFPKDEVFGEEEFSEKNHLIFGEDLGKIIVDKYKEAYAHEDEDYRVVYGKEMSHYYFDCPSRLMARYASNTTTSSVYFYANSHPVLFDFCVQQNGGNKTGCYFATHASEVSYVFRTVDENENYQETDRIVENQFSTYWGSFARTGNPSNGLETSLGSFSKWIEYVADNANGATEPWQHLHITAPTSSVEFGYKKDICDFWDEINYGIGFQPSTDVSSTTTQQYPTTSKATSHRSSFGITVYAGVAVILAQFLQQ